MVLVLVLVLELGVCTAGVDADVAPTELMWLSAGLGGFLYAPEPPPPQATMEDEGRSMLIAGASFAARAGAAAKTPSNSDSRAR